MVSLDEMGANHLDVSFKKQWGKRGEDIKVLTPPRGKNATTFS